MGSREIVRRLEAAGYVLVRVRGSHHIFRGPDGRVIPVPHPRKDLPLGTARNILKRAGLE
jgi:predicted RNA binding protein YcfA (HicA-like mRNA interferase family)